VLTNGIATERIILQPFAPDAFEAAYTWFGDPYVMRYTPTGPDRSREQTRRRLAEYAEHQALYGFSKWAIALPGGDLIGDAGLLHTKDSGEIELGFRLMRNQWGRGYATEVATAWVEAAREQFSLPRVMAFAHPDNGASLRILEKVGFRYSRYGVMLGMQAVVYESELSPVAISHKSEPSRLRR